MTTSDNTTPTRRPDPRLRIITEAIRKPSPTHQTVVTLTGAAPDGCGLWQIGVHELALHVYTRLYGRTAEQASPLEQAEDAKRARDLTGEIGALQHGQAALESAPWYPAEAGDVVHIHYEATSAVPEAGETYVVEHSDAEGGLVLRVLHSTPGVFFSPGCFAPGMAGDPLLEPWFEAGPAALTIVRHGRIVHGGTLASAGPSS